ncbi:MAG: NB-ARC domain-containing protein [Caldilineaceae bacterium]
MAHIHAATVRLYLLGQFHLLRNDQPVIEEFRSDKARALLAYLVLEGDRPLARDHLAHLLWEGYALKTARASLRVTLSNLRQVLKPLQLLRTTNQSVYLQSDNRYFWCDALAFSASHHLPTGPQGAPVAPGPSSLESGELLAGFDQIDSRPFQSWLQARRRFYQNRQGSNRQALSLPDAASLREPNDTRHAEGISPAAAPPRAVAPTTHWFAAPEISHFYGRDAELAQLQQWVGEEGCRVVAILGMGGQGKTALAATFVHTLQVTAFDLVIWRSLLNAPPLPEILQTWLQLLSGQTLDELPPSLDRQLDRLLDQLQRRRCLLVLDNAESIMMGGERAGAYRPGYEGYGQILQRIATTPHQSCLLLTSREEPYGLQPLAIGAQTVQLLRMGGLAATSSWAMLQALGLHSGEEVGAQLVARYSGNPLALKLAAAVIQDLFGGNVRAFLAEETLVFDDIRDVLEQHLARLTPLECELLYWLAIEREPVSFGALHDNLVEAVQRTAALEAIRSLQRRLLLEVAGEHLGLQNVIIEYVTERLVTAVCRELRTLAAPTAPRPARHQLTQSHLNHFPLVKAQAKEYVRASQVRLLLQPVAEWTVAQWGKPATALHLQQLLDHLRSAAPLAPGYVAANLLHLLLHLQIDLRGFDFSQLVLRQADLRQAHLPSVNLTKADVSQSLFTEPMEIARCLHISPDGQLLATGTANGQIQLWRLADHQLIRELPAHIGPIYTVAFSPDGRWLASGGADNMVYLWELATGECRCRLHGHAGEVLLVAFTADGATLFSLSHDNTLCLWEMQRLLTTSFCDQPRRHVSAGGQDIYRAAGGPMLAVSGGDSNVIYCWDILNGRLQATLYEAGNVITAVAVSLDGKLVASSSNDQTIRLWALNGRSAQAGHAPPLCVLPAAANALAFSPDGALLASAFEQHLCLWEVASGRLCWRTDGHQGRITMLVFSPTGRTLVSTSYDQTTRFWDVDAGQTEYILHGQANWVDFVKFSPNGASLVSSAVDHTAHLWAHDGHHLHALRGHHGAVQHYAFSTDNQLLAIGSGLATTIHIWDVKSGDVRHTLRQHTSAISANLAASPAGRTLASGSEDQTVCLWDMGTGELHTVLHGHTSHIKYIAFNPTGDLLATASSDCTVRIWSLPGGQLAHVLRGHDALCSFLAFHPAGRLLASTGEDKTVRLWDTVTGQLCQTLAEHTQSVLYVNFSCDGRWLVSISEDQQMRIWTAVPSAGVYELRHVLPEHIFKLNCAVCTPTGRWLVTGGMDRAVRVWDLEEGQVYRTFTGHTNIITSVDISPTGQQIVSSSSDGTVRRWDMQTGQCLQVLRPTGPYTGMNITGVTGITAAQRAALKTLGAVEEPILHFDKG